jgi:pimeloyl-ACP methyl ester carboxylesterase
MTTSRTETRTVTSGGVKLAVDVGGEGPLVVLAHGFPELAYSWRHQVPALLDAGYRVAVPDQRGYGRSDRPAAIEDYDVLHLTDDLLAVLDSLGEERAIFVGHDWGALVVWQLALLAPERVAAVVGMSVPFLPRAPMPTITLLRQIYADGFFYMVYFQEPGVADAELASDPARTMRRLLAGTRADADAADAASFSANDGRGFIERLPEPKGLPGWLTEDELDFYVGEFTRTGFTGGLNWYRNLDRNWHLTEPVAEAHVTCPSLFIAGSLDPVATFAPADAGLAWLDDHRGNVLIEGAGHWVQQERAPEVNAALLGFLHDVVDSDVVDSDVVDRDVADRKAHP